MYNEGPGVKKIRYDGTMASLRVQVVVNGTVNTQHLILRSLF